MGEKRVRAGVASAATQALKPLYDSLGDLAVALDAATQEHELRAAAEHRAQRIMADAQARADELRAATEARIIDLHAAAQRAWQAARDAGWTERQLTSPPLNLRLPAPAPRRRRRSSSTTAATRQAVSPPDGDVPAPRDADHPTTPVSSTPTGLVDDWQ